MLRMWVLTVFTETDSSLAISGRERLVGRYRSTLSSLGLSSSAGGDGGWWLAGKEAPCTRSRMSASRAACAVWCRGSASSSSPARHGKRQDQPVRLGQGEGAFGSLVRRPLVAERTVGEPGQQLGLNDRDRPDDRSRAIEDLVAAAAGLQPPRSPGAAAA
jgi:hypothetical protein